MNATLSIYKNILGLVCVCCLGELPVPRKEVLPVAGMYLLIFIHYLFVLVADCKLKFIWFSFIIIFLVFFFFLNTFAQTRRLTNLNLKFYDYLSMKNTSRHLEF